MPLPKRHALPDKPAYAGRLDRVALARLAAICASAGVQVEQLVWGPVSLRSIPDGLLIDRIKAGRSGRLPVPEDIIEKMRWWASPIIGIPHRNQPAVPSMPGAIKPMAASAIARYTEGIDVPHEEAKLLPEFEPTPEYEPDFADDVAPVKTKSVSRLPKLGATPRS